MVEGQSGDEDEDEEPNFDAEDMTNDIFGWGLNENWLLLSKRELKEFPTKLKFRKSRILRIEVQHGNFIGYLIGDDVSVLDDDSYLEGSLCGSELDEIQDEVGELGGNNSKYRYITHRSRCKQKPRFKQKEVYFWTITDE